MGSSIAPRCCRADVTSTTLFPWLACRLDRSSRHPLPRQSSAGRQQACWHRHDGRRGRTDHPLVGRRLSEAALQQTGSRVCRCRQPARCGHQRRIGVGQNKQGSGATVGTVRRRQRRRRHQDLPGRRGRPTRSRRRESSSTLFARTIPPIGCGWWTRRRRVLARLGCAT